MDSQQQANELEDRLIDFGVRIINLAQKLPDTKAGQHIAGQILRSGTSPAPNYSESRAAESRNDFKHKLGIVFKELNETKVWVKMIVRSQMVKGKRLTQSLDENEQLCKIIGASRRTARGPA